MRTKEEALTVATEIMKKRFPAARVGFCAGSYFRDEATPYSDIDLVVVFEKLPFAYQESFVFGDWPVEAFVHDPETLHHFFAGDAARGVPSLQQMVWEGVQIPNSCVLGDELKAFARRILDAGPESLTEDSVRNQVYAITDLVDDLREPRSKSEAVATGVRLYGNLSDFYLRLRGEWSAFGKSIPRRLRAVDPDFASRFETAFDALFSSGDPALVIRLAEEAVRPAGGFLFDGYRRNAPADWRKAHPAKCCP